MTDIAVIGYGLQVSRLIKLLQGRYPECKLVAITDIRTEHVKMRLDDEGVDHSSILFYDDADEMLRDRHYDGVFIGTRCSQHTPMALKVLEKGFPLYLEKPVATTMKDLVLLRDAYRKSSSPVVVSFPLRVTYHVQLVKELIDSGKIGTVEHVQAVNNVAYGGVYYHYWYRDEAETQGLFLQKATHDFDYINYVLGLKPVSVSAMTSKRVFTGNKPAGLMCKNCDEQDTCQESPQNLRKVGEEPLGDYCSFAEDTGNEDSGSALVRYETGMHVSYSQNFFVRKKAGTRGARFIGYKGTIEFDWYSDEVKVYMHHAGRTEIYKIDQTALSGGHGGGDSTLMDNFMEIMKDRKKASVSPLESGLESALLCLRAKESAETGTLREVTWPDTPTYTLLGAGL